MALGCEYALIRVNFFISKVGCNARKCSTAVNTSTVNVHNKVGGEEDLIENTPGQNALQGQIYQ